MTPNTPTIDPGYAGRLRNYERGVGLVLWVGLAATIVWLG